MVLSSPLKQSGDSCCQISVAESGNERDNRIDFLQNTRAYACWGNLYKSKIGRIKNDIIGRFSLLGDKNFRGPGARLLPIDLMVSIEHRVKLKPGRRVLLVSVDGRLVRSCCSPARSSLEASLLPVGQHDPKRPHRSRAENFFENLLHRLLRHPRAGFLIVAIMRNVKKI